VILLFCVSRAYAQVGPPSLRCLEVLANNDVIIKWIPPVDPGGVFNSYDIYTSPSAGGPFTLLVNLPGSITQAAYTDPATIANLQSVYYYMVSRSGPAGANVSAHSDTLKTIFLNLNPGNGSQEYLKLTYNHLHQPKLSTTLNTFTLLKEYPMGTWSTFAASNNITYNDTLSVCQASLNYQVRILDNSGCISTSNHQGGVFNDKKDPAEPVIDSISVLPNGTVILAWHIPRDLDITKYRIYQLISSGSSTINAAIDTLNGRNNSSYTFITNAAYGQSISLFLSSIDSCNRISPFTNSGGTMNLKLLYDRCQYKSVIAWNPYKNMPKGIKEYRVYYSTDGANFNVIGTTTGTTFTHTGVAPDKSICYFVRAFNADETVTSSSNWHCFFSTQVKSPSFLYVKSAGVLADKTTQLRLFLDTSKYSKGIDVFRSEDGTSYQPVGYVPTTNTPDYTFIDKNEGGTDTMSYYYKASIKDSCGNTRSTSNIAKTILLKVAEDREFIFTKHLKWTAYSGFAGGVNSYNIYRVINGSGTPKLIGNTALLSNTYSDNLEDEAPNGSKVEYLVEAVEGTGNPYGFMETATSNLKNVYMEGRIFIPTAFAPNGKNRIWLPITHFIDKKEYSVKIFNRWGNKVFETADDTVGWDGDGAPNGIYAYVISYKNARGEYQELKGTLMLL
jgi:gliding motility-associated-like protein